jgi:predicted Zn finger-like uncharacterized protein
MIAACPKCGARYRIDDGRLPEKGARLRCARCEAVFRVSPPKRDSAPELASPEPAQVPQARTEGPQRAAGERSPTEAEPRSERPGPLVLVADPEPEGGRATVRAIESWGLGTRLVHDGVEAILTIQREMPKAVVLDAALPKMFGFQVCELMKRNESLRHIHVVLVGAIHDRDRYRRPPSQLYGADAYIERPDLPDALRPILRDVGIVGKETAETGAGAPPPAPATPRAPAPEPAPAPPPVAAPAPPTPPTPPGVSAEAIGQAERLARIVVSDIVLYNPEKFEAALSAGNPLEALADELAEGRGLFQQRVDARVRETRDFLAEELTRVARQRGMK